MCATYRWKACDEGYNFALDLITIEGLHTNLWAPKVARINCENFKIPCGSLETKNHLDVAPVERCKVYYNREGGAFSQVQAVESLLNMSCPWCILTPKVFKLCSNHLVLVLCRSVWVVEACQFFLIPCRSSNTFPYPSKVLWARERAPILYSFVIFSLDSHLSPSWS
jgi:hypothetical protein